MPPHWLGDVSPVPSIASKGVMARACRKVSLGAVGFSLAATAIGAASDAALSTASASILDLNGMNVILPDDKYFGGRAYLNGTDNVTNNGSVTATLTEGGGPVGTTTYSGVISDGSALTA